MTRAILLIGLLLGAIGIGILVYSGHPSYLISVAAALNPAASSALAYKIGKDDQLRKWAKP